MIKGSSLPSRSCVTTTYKNMISVFSTGECKASEQYVRQLEDVLDHCAPKAGVAGFIAEYIQVGGDPLEYTLSFCMCLVYQGSLSLPRELVVVYICLEAI